MSLCVWNEVNVDGINNADAYTNQTDKGSLSQGAYQGFYRSVADIF